jgi:hypothetical protein
MSIEENKAVVRRLAEELDRGNLDILKEHPGLDEVRPMLMQLLAARQAGQIQERVEEMIAEGDWVAVRAIRTGGPFGDGIEEIAMLKIVDGHIVKQHSQGGPIGAQPSSTGD